MKHVVVLVVALLFLGSCKQNPVEVGELPVGSIYGYVHVWDVDSVSPDQSGVLVKLEGTNISALTNAKGEWKLEDVPSRTYTVTFSKPGYGTVIDFDYRHLGGAPTLYADPFNFRIEPIPACPAEIVSLTQTNGEIFFKTNVPCKGRRWPLVVYYFSNSPDVSSDLKKHLTSAPHDIDPYNDRYPVLRREDFEGNGSWRNTGLSLTDSIYVVAYSVGGSSCTLDPATGRKHYSSLHPVGSNVKSFKLD
jgi:hypothetical protein